VPVSPQAAVGHLGLRLPFRGAADIHPDAESWLDADHGAVRPVCLDMVDAIPEGHQGRPARMDEAVEKLAVRELRLADAVPAHLDSASDVFPGHPAWVGLVGRWAQRHAAAGPCTPDEAQSAA
jgi:hypothetical protein